MKMPLARVPQGRCHAARARIDDAHPQASRFVDPRREREVQRASPRGRSLARARDFDAERAGTGDAEAQAAVLGLETWRLELQKAAPSLSIAGQLLAERLLQGIE